MVTSQYERKILEWDEKSNTNARIAKSFAMRINLLCMYKFIFLILLSSSWIADLRTNLKESWDVYIGIDWMYMYSVLLYENADLMAWPLLMRTLPRHLSWPPTCCSRWLSCGRYSPQHPCTSWRRTNQPSPVWLGFSYSGPNKDGVRLKKRSRIIS